MKDTLPRGWVKTRLGDICLPVAKVRPEDFPSAEFTYFDIGGIDNERNRISETKTFLGRNAPSRARQEVRKDKILFSTVRTYLRKIARIESDYQNPVASTGFTVIRPAAGISSRLNLQYAEAGAYGKVVDSEQQWAIKGETSPRHRVWNNLPGTPAFCPLVFRTAAFLLLKDSKSSYAIEGERPAQGCGNHSSRQPSPTHR